MTHDDEYLWSKTGPPDPEVLRLERMLAGHRFQSDRAPSTRRMGAWYWAAASIAAGLALAFWLFQQSDGPGYAIEGLADRTHLGEGEALEFERESVLAIAELGDVRVAAGSRLRVDQAGGDAHRLFLEEGRVHARIWAEPRVFQIGTPAGLSVDLGCEYEIEVDGEGVTELSVRTGRVAFETAGRKVLVPAGARCRSWPDRGPDTPIFGDADPAFESALRAVESESLPDSEAIEALLDREIVRREDSLSLFHLLDAPSRELRERVLEFLCVTYPLPEGISAAAILDGQEGARRSWRADMEFDWR